MVDAKGLVASGLPSAERTDEAEVAWEELSGTVLEGWIGDTFIT